MREQKKSILASFQSSLLEFRKRNQLTASFDRWLNPDLNNALFASVSTYHNLGPAFEQLLLLKNGDLKAFHQEVIRIASLDQKERVKILTHLSTLQLAARKPVDHHSQRAL
jgi:predicted aminopeptidase